MSESETNGKPANEPDKERLLAPISVKKIKVKTSKYLAKTNGGLEKVHYFSPRHLEFLQVYAETLDLKLALEKSGVKRAEIDKSAYMLKEIDYINTAARFKHRNKIALGRHEQLIDKGMQLLEETNDKKVKASLLSTLFRGSETALKVAGEFGDQPENTGITGVRVVINLNAPKPQESPVIEIPAERIE